MSHLPKDNKWKIIGYYYHLVNFNTFSVAHQSDHIIGLHVLFKPSSHLQIVDKTNC